jgi:hypothetical protein
VEGWGFSVFLDRRWWKCPKMGLGSFGAARIWDSAELQREWGNRLGMGENIAIDMIEGSRAQNDYPISLSLT